MTVDSLSSHFTTPFSPFQLLPSVFCPHVSIPSALACLPFSISFISVHLFIFAPFLSYLSSFTPTALIRTSVLYTMIITAMHIKSRFLSQLDLLSKSLLRVFANQSGEHSKKLKDIAAMMTVRTLAVKCIYIALGQLKIYMHPLQNSTSLTYEYWFHWKEAVIYIMHLLSYTHLFNLIFGESNPLTLGPNRQFWCSFVDASVTMLTVKKF